MNRPKWLQKGDVMVTAWAEQASGPGIIPLFWVLVMDESKKYRVETLYHGDLSRELRVLFPISAALQNALIPAIDNQVHGVKRSKSDG